MQRYFPVLFPIFGCLFAYAPISAQSPCDSPVHRQFDFWVGDWEVFDPVADTIVGYNHIRNILEGCVIEENWTGKSGFQGKSFNTYHLADSTWRQVWVDQGGATYHFSGRFRDHVMQMYGETTAKTGQNILFDMAYHHDPERGTVRQIWKASRDGGNTWNILFEGIYRKKKQDPDR